MVRPAYEAAKLLKEEGISCTVLDMYCVKPFDTETALAAIKKSKAVVTVEEHTKIGGLGAMVSQLVASECPKFVLNLGLPDSPVVTGNSAQVFAHYGLTGEGIAASAKELLNKISGRYEDIYV